MENTYTFEEYEIKINDSCHAWVEGKAYYEAEWQDGTTNTHYGKINCRMELKDVKIELIELASYALYATATEDTLHMHIAEVDCHAFNNGSTKEFITWLESALGKDGSFEEAVMNHAEDQGYELPEPPERIEIAHAK
tara:strand:+ start:197 stop:607 length:411 start_codon:yes stop_codon:yes gene_type:complete